jgi:hypothetical protein
MEALQQGSGDVVGDPVAVGGRRGGLGQQVDGGKQGKARVAAHVHDVAEAFLAGELEGDERQQAVEGGDHLRAGQPGAGRPSLELPCDQGGDEDEQAAGLGFEGVEQSSARTSAVSAGSGCAAGGRSSARRRSNLAKPCWRRIWPITVWLTCEPAAARIFWMS